MKKLDFIGLGVQRAATTWLHNCLKQHPQLNLPKQKEMQFFNAFYDKGYDWYFESFKHFEPDALWGEITPNYFYSKQAIDRIKENFPDSKLIVIFREPFSRTCSAFELFKEKRFQNMDIVEACEKAPYLINESLYAENYQYLLSKFPKDNVLALVYEDIEEGPEKTLKRVFQFLGVDENMKLEAVGTRYNKVVYPKLQKFLIKLKLNFIIELVKKTVLGDYIRKKQEHVVPSDNLSLLLGVEKYKQLFHQDIEQLETLLGRDLSSWKDKSYAK